MFSSSNATTGDTNIVVLAGGIVGAVMIVLLTIFIVICFAIYYYKKRRENHHINKLTFTQTSNIHNYSHNTSTNPCFAQGLANTRAIGKDSRICKCFYTTVRS